MVDLITLIVLLVVTYITGTTIERRHFKRLLERERQIVRQPFLSNNYTALTEENVEELKFVSGSCVIAADKFKRFISGLKSLFGGKLTAYEGLLDRARREAVLRMREQAEQADMIVQSRLETSEIGDGMVEIVAYGTAVYLKK